LNLATLEDKGKVSLGKHVVTADTDGALDYTAVRACKRAKVYTSSVLTLIRRTTNWAWNAGKHWGSEKFRHILVAKYKTDPGADGRKTLRRILREKNVRLCAGFVTYKRHTGSELTGT